MKKMLIFLLIPIIIISCSKDDNNEQQIDVTTDYFPLSVNYSQQVTHKRYRNNNLIEDLGKINRKVLKVETFDEKNTFLISSESQDEELLNIEMYAIEENKIYVYSNIINNMVEYAGSLFGIDLPLNVDDGWILLADFNKKEWKTYEKTIENEALGENNTISGKISINCSHIEDIEVIVLENKTKTKKYKLEYHFEGQVDDDFPVNFKINVYTTFGKNIGIIKSNVDETQIDLKIVGFPIGGIVEEIVSYNLE
jgi:Holliday junction resolvase